MRFTPLKYMFQWCLVRSHSCVTIPICLILENVHDLKKKPRPLGSHSPAPPLWPLATTICFVSGFACCGYFRIISVVLFCDWLLSLRRFSRFIHVVTCHSFVLFTADTTLYGHLFVFQLMVIWGVSTFWLLGIVLLWTFVYKFLCGHTFSFLLAVHLGVELLGQTVALCLTFWGNTRLFSKTAVPFYISTSNPCEDSDFSTSALVGVSVTAIASGVKW